MTLTSSISCGNGHNGNGHNGNGHNGNGHNGTGNGHIKITEIGRSQSLMPKYSNIEKKNTTEI